MAFLLQRRNLKDHVQRQLSNFHDLERRNTALRNKSRPAGDISSDPEESTENEKGDEIERSKDANAIEHPYTCIPGITLVHTPNGKDAYVVGWNSPEDPQNPHNWTYMRRFKTVLILFLIAFVVPAASSIDAAVLKPAAQDLGVAKVTEALGGTGIFLVGLAFGALICSPLSELVGRFPVYLVALVLFGIWEMAAALAPNIGAQIAFRFLAGLCGAPPFTVAGGSLSDIFDSREKTWAFPIFAISGFGSPTLGPVMGAWIGTDGWSWRWAEWTILIVDGIVIVLVLMCNEETLASRLLETKAAYFREMTGDDCFTSQPDRAALGPMLKTAFARPFILAREPIVLAWTFYLVIVYIVLFTFLDGYTYIFKRVYGIGQELTSVCFVGLFIGIVLHAFIIPIVYQQTVRRANRRYDAEESGSHTNRDRELRLLFAIIGAPAVPVGLFWMAWTDMPSISIWSPLVASVFIGFGFISIYVSAYMYIIDAYEVHAASALTFTALVRYLAGGGTRTRRHLLSVTCADFNPRHDGSWCAILSEYGSELHAYDSGMHQCDCGAYPVCAVEMGTEDPGEESVCVLRRS